jgi:hypothetical protein
VLRPLSKKLCSAKATPVTCARWKESLLVTNSEPRLTTGQEEVIKEAIWKFCECSPLFMVNLVASSAISFSGI